MAANTAEWQIPPVTDETVGRYRANYTIPPSVELTKEMIERHASLEYALTQTLLQSRQGERRRVWTESYDTLYRDLPWLAATPVRKGHTPTLEYGHFLRLIAPATQKIDIGSGVGVLATFLTENGRPCVATEITGERGKRDVDGIEWHVTDGIHLSDFEERGTYDNVVPTQVIEHFHPDDVPAHFEGAFALLKPGGQYIFTTPHAFLGPADLSTVFRLDRPRFMHLKEYTHRELGEIARAAGFGRIEAVYIPPSAIRKRLPFMTRSRLLYRYLAAMEKLLANVRLPRVLLRAMLFSGDVFMAVRKP